MCEETAAAGWGSWGCIVGEAVAPVDAAAVVVVDGGHDEARPPPGE